MWDGRTVDNYHVNLIEWCPCLRCKLMNGYKEGPAFSCKKYPGHREIPKKIWNGRNEYCKYYVRKDET